MVLEDEVINVYCHMTMGTTGNGACSNGGWTLVIKMDGNQVNSLLVSSRYINLNYLMKQYKLKFLHWKQAADSAYSFLNIK